MPRTKRNDKRDRLIEAADTLIFQYGFNTTTLADIAKEADVPLGNVYYYFKTKESILEAVIAARALADKAAFDAWNQLETPQARLQAYIEHHVSDAETTARYGCALGSLCQELGKKGGQTSAQAARLMGETLKWIQAQFKELGKPEDAGQLAEYFLAQVQGVCLLGLTFKDPSIITRQTMEILDELGITTVPETAEA